MGASIMRRVRNRQELTQDFILKIFKQEKKPIAPGELVAILSLDKKQGKSLKQILKNLARDGSIVELKNKRYGLPREMNLVSGTLWCTRSGNGFIIPDNPDEKDIFVPSRFIKNAFHGDKVIARVEHSFRGKKEGSIIKVTQRKLRNIVGFIHRDGKATYLIPEDERISHHFLVSKSLKSTNLTENDLVAARVTRFPEGGADPACTILKVFKGLRDVRSIIQYVQYKSGLPFRFKKRTEDEAQVIDPSSNLSDRLDLRDTMHVTIDGELAKDFDDAVCIEKNDNGFALYVSIADVSHYVSPGSNLDREAYDRGTSVYFPGTVVPMLPKTLSNIICSLNPYEDRLTMTVKLTFNTKGDLTNASFHKSIIRSILRLTYNEVEDALIRKDRSIRKEVQNILPALEHMGELAALLSEKREKRGSLDFDLPEPDVILNIEGGIQNILRAERLFSHRIIEEFMIAANEAVANLLAENNINTMYRIHEPPDAEKLKDMERLLQALSIGYNKRDRRNIVGLQSILRNVEGTSYEFLVNRVLLRSMKQARYSSQNKGHFGLASDCYLHFTSPIRRYPDLVCHRALKSLIANDGKTYSQKELEPMANYLSERERLAMEAEREIEDRIRVLFMKEKVGETYDGIISHIASFGFFVELNDVFVEGLVLLNTLYDDYYHFEEERFRLVGRRSRKIYRVGDKVNVRITLADVEKNQLHFALISTKR
jgi:ribonuclease R